MHKPVPLLCVAALAGLCILFSSYVQRTGRSSADVTIERDLELRVQPFSPSTEPVLQVTVAAGTVTLEGKIANQYDHNALIEIAKAGAGTNRIVDRLTLTEPVAKAGMSTPDTKERYGAWLAAHHHQKSITD